MIQMGVDKVKMPVSSLVVKQSPSRRTAASGVPAQRRLERSFRQPICSPLLKLYTLCVVKDGHVLPIVDAIFSPHTDTLVARAMLDKIIQLEIKGFLNSEHGRTLVEDHRASGVPAVLPYMFPVISRSVTDIERHDGKGLDRILITTLAREEKQRQKGKKEDSFHFLMVLDSSLRSE